MTIEGKDHFVRGSIFLDTWRWLYLRCNEDGYLRVRGYGNSVMDAYANRYKFLGMK